MKRLGKRLTDRFLRSIIGRVSVSGFCRVTQYRVFAPRTVRLMQMDVARLRARNRANGDCAIDLPMKLHLGCGNRTVTGWLNADVSNSEYDVDLGGTCLPWNDGQFQAIVSQHVVEHLELESELLPLLSELARVAMTGCEIWLSCPDLAKICNSYNKDKGQGLIEDRMTRPHKDLGMDGIPSQHIINRLFHQCGEHKNLYDFELLEWALTKCGFSDCTRVKEQDLLVRFPGFPARNDDYVSLYVRATR